MHCDKSPEAFSDHVPNAFFRRLTVFKKWGEHLLQKLRAEGRRELTLGSVQYNDLLQGAEKQVVIFVSSKCAEDWRKVRRHISYCDTTQSVRRRSFVSSAVLENDWKMMP